MKTTLFFILGVVFSISTRAQFPSPTNFQFSLHYFMIGDGGYCDNNFLIGPAYCTNFSWLTPDTSGIDASLSYYKVHYKRDTTIFSPPFDTAYLTTQNSLSVELGVMGWVWVTAVYSNPDGESDSSNVEYNYNLPIGVKENPSQPESILNYNTSTNVLLVKYPKEIRQLRFVNALGKCLKTIKNVGSDICLNDLCPGIYIIEIQLRNHSRIFKKIVVS